MTFDLVLDKGLTLGYSLFMFVLILSIIVFIHELGHYVAARMYNVKVDEFSIGMGKELWGMYDKNNTRWKISMLPIGGYVKLVGEEGITGEVKRKKNGTTTIDDTKAHIGEQLSMDEISPFARIVIFLAGPLFNYILTFTLFAVLLVSFGLPQPMNQGLLVHETKQNALEGEGLRKGDIIYKIEEHEIQSAKSFISTLDQYLLKSSKDLKPIKFHYTRKNINAEVEHLTSSYLPIWQVAVKKMGFGIVGSDVTEKRILGPIDGILKAGYLCVKMTGLYISALKNMIVERSFDSLTGPIGIAKASGKVSLFDIEKLLTFIASISLALGFFNLLPIPPLDGGNILVYAIEMVIGPRYSAKLHYVLSMVGLTLILLLTVFVFYNDINNLFN